MNRLSSRNNWLKFKIAGKLLIVLEGFIEYTPKLLKENRRMWTCNRLDLQTLESQPVMPKNVPDHCSELGPAPPFPPMRVLEVLWSRALSLVREVALNCVKTGLSPLKTPWPTNLFQMAVGLPPIPCGSQSDQKRGHEGPPSGPTIFYDSTSQKPRMVEAREWIMACKMAKWTMMPCNNIHA